ncbi:hypothetical protein AWM79_24005 [Pseudomonas agarici]|uniref:Uncharacterized protein n=2 Tax=Pseudomonas agarici TaxID=46677 RepID=A0A0X1T8D0_PSEAA|nr:hypothetical protein [Pseudomonas agarici]AMB88173.1 hypothetical protein AWM79_24005 [Pseudomonas agarici]NWB93563.1 hypothetical protein [Pseudomonas agarici]NWC11135.1 hypothetical protein [Pseudomonas agarici]SEL57947.1 hypothetical protein SAMN05216604_1235 [Pseudomonas agarici]
MGYQYVFFRSSQRLDVNKPDYSVFEKGYPDGAGWTPSTTDTYKPFEQLDDSYPFGANPTAFFDKENESIYMLLRTNNYLGITGCKIYLQNLRWNIAGVDLSITSEESVIPYLTNEHLHLFYQESKGQISWSQYSFDYNSEKIEPLNTVTVSRDHVQLDGYPSISVRYKPESKKYIGRLFFRNKSNLMCSLRIDDLEKMKIDESSLEVYSEIEMQHSPSVLSTGDDRGFTTFYVFYHSKEKTGEMLCAKIDGFGKYISKHKLKSFNNDIKSSPSTLMVDYPNAYVFYTSAKRDAKKVEVREISRAWVNLKDMEVVSTSPIKNSNPLGSDAAPFALDGGDVLIKNFSGV